MAYEWLNQLSDLIGGSFSLSQEAFQKIVSLPEGQTITLLVVLAVGLSLAMGQSIFYSLIGSRQFGSFSTCC